MSMNFKNLSLLIKRGSVASLSALFLSGCQSGEPSFSLTSVQQSLKQGSARRKVSKIDILWVVDNSLSMRASQDDLAKNFDSFISNFSNKDLDYQMAVTTTEAYLANPQYSRNASPDYSRFRTGDGETTDSGIPIITPETENLSDVFLTNIRVGIDGSFDERAFSSIEETLINPDNEGLIREDSFLAVIIVSDENDASRKQLTDNKYGKKVLSVESFVNTLDKITLSTEEKRKYSLSSIHIMSGDKKCKKQQEDAMPGPQGQKYGTRYEKMVKMTGGKNISLCSDFSESLDLLSKSIISSSLKDEFILDREPVESSLRVFVSGTPIPKSVNGSPGWEYLNPSEGEYVLKFVGDTIPTTGAAINVYFDPKTFQE